MRLDEDTLLALLPEISDIKDTVLREKVVQIWQEACEDGNVKAPEKVPKNLKNTCYTLINHTRMVARLCITAAQLAMERHRIDANLDYLLAGALLHDVSKLLEIGADGKEHFATEFGKKIQHGFYAAYKAYEKKLPLEIQHILVSHTPQSAIMPQSIEAVILYNIDQTDTEILNQSLGIPLSPKR